VPEAVVEQPFLLATLPPTPRQIRLALVIVAALLVALVLTIPFVNTRLPRVDSFIPVLETAISFNDLITSALLFAQFFIIRRYGLLAIANGFLFTALIVIPHALSFPGAFAPMGLLGAGTQTTGMLYYFWHVGSPLALIIYALLKDADSGTSTFRHSPVTVVGWSVAVVIAIVCGLTWIATAADSLMPAIFLDSFQMNRVPHLVGGLLLSFWTAVPLVLLWFRRRSVLDLWLLVMCSAWLVEVTLNAFLDARFNLGFYASRIYNLIGTAFVLLVLLSETTAIYAHLARSTIKQRRDREARQIAMDAMAASIAHEVNQPLSAMVMNANAALRLLTKATPDLDEVRASLEDIVDDGHRAGEVIGGVRSMFKKDAHGRLSLDPNDVVREVLTMVDVDLRAHHVSVSIELHDGLPQLVGDRGQLYQVYLNLIMNAIEAMRTITDRARLLRIKSEFIQESSDVLITVEDSGTGIDTKDKDRIFEPFFTTKSSGTGIGLSICRSIIESHGGSLLASANTPYGTIIQVSLPSGSI